MTPEERQQAITVLSDKHLQIHRRMGTHVVLNAIANTLVGIPMENANDKWKRLLEESEKVEKELSDMKRN